MIYFFAHPRNTYPICTYKKSDPYGGAAHILLLPYDAASLADVEADLAGATCIFADIELLLRGELPRLATALYERVSSGEAKILNQPGRTLAREQLLKALALKGVNDFRAHRVSDLGEVRFPAFLRSAYLHHGSYSPLLHDQRQLERAIVASHLRGRDLQDLLIVEFLDSAGDDGLYRKYSAFVVNEAIIPRHLFFDRHWLVKTAAFESDATNEEELHYVQTNPHEAELLEISRIAEVEYGRIDYGIADGRIQVWEINTNPAFGVSGGHRGSSAARRRVHDLFLRRFADRLGSLDARGSVPSPGEDDPQRICSREEAKPKGPLARRLSGMVDSLLFLLAAGMRHLLMPRIRRRTFRGEGR